MSDIFAGGVHSTAISNITAEINACIVTQADGTKVLNEAALLAWVIAQMRQMVTDGEATSDSYVATAQQNAPGIIAACGAVIDPSNWQARPDWPAHSDTTSAQQSASVAGVLAQQAKLKNLAATATAFFADTPDLMSNIINDYFTANVVPDIGVGVTLLEENRAYVCTYVTDRGEESAWSPASELIECDQNDTVTVTIPAAPSGRFISYFRLYRSSTTNTSQAFQDVPNPGDNQGWPIGTLTITDDKKQGELQEPGPTQLWDEPPADLRGIVAGANGVLAGFRENEFCPCVPEEYYAYPVSMRVTTESPIVGLAYLDQTYFVGTRGYPYFITGADAQTFIAEKLDADQPCTSRKGIVAMRGGFVWPTPSGLCFANQGGVELITGPDGLNLFSRDEWQALDPSSIVAREREGAYVFEWNNGTDSGTYALDLGTRKLVTFSVTASAFFRDSITDQLYYASGLAIKALGASDTMREGRWRTKIVTLEDEPSFAWLQVQSSFDDDATVTVNIYGDGALIQTETVASRDPVRVVPGRYREWEVEVLSTLRAASVKLASTSEELQQL